MNERTQRREGEGVILNRKICLLERRCRKHAQLGYNIGMHVYLDYDMEEFILGRLGDIRHAYL
jgi:hypothetical protein